MAHGLNEDILSGARNSLYRLLSFGSSAPQETVRSWIYLWLLPPFWKV